MKKNVRDKVEALELGGSLSVRGGGCASRCRGHLDSLELSVEGLGTVQS